MLRLGLALKDLALEIHVTTLIPVLLMINAVQMVFVSAAWTVVIWMGPATRGFVTLTSPVRHN